MRSKTGKNISTGIIGFGSSGKHLHAPLLIDSPHFSLDAIATKSSSQSRHLPAGTAQRTPAQIISDPSIDLVIVATPNDSHYYYARLALEAGKHVVVEKPIALESAQIFSLELLAKKNKKILSTFHNRLFDGDFLAITKLITDHTLGNIHSYAAQVNRYWPQVLNNWRDNPDYGGAVWELAPNLIIQALTLFGKPCSIFADISTMRKNAKAPDAFYLRLIYPKLNVELRCNSLIKHTGPRYFIHGDNGSYIKQGVDHQHRQLKNNISPRDKNYGKESIDDWGSLYSCTENFSKETLWPSPRGNYPEFYNQLYQSITKNTAAPAAQKHAIDVISIITAAYQSSARKQVISL
ncbi:MAG: Gfo/Idh/MocA family oxidoreductase [Gammaproteobacteria bacterium]|nr:Gfo/Idh/MocA family oxidoreductase [Gammaproteobacteria bacterium]